MDPMLAKIREREAENRRRYVSERCYATYPTGDIPPET